MNRPIAAAPLAATPTRLMRRMILGGAFLLGLAVALAPRTPTVHAQEPATSPAAAPTPQSATKTVTITNGRGGKVTIEAGESAEPTVKINADGKANADNRSPADAESPGSRGHNVAFGEHGRVRIDGLGADRDYDSFGQFVDNEPALAAMVIAVVAVVFLAPVLAIALVLWYRMRKARMLNETMLKLAEKGIVPSADALEALAGGKQAAVVAPFYEQAKQVQRRAAWSDLRKGVLMSGFGLALSVYSLIEDREANGLGLVLLFVGLGFVVLWWFEERHLAPANRTPPAPVAVPGSGVPPGNAPPA
jgi:hypothetical protein